MKEVAAEFERRINEEVRQQEKVKKRDIKKRELLGKFMVKNVVWIE